MKRRGDISAHRALRNAALLSAGAAGLAVVAAAVAGHPRAGVALAAGLVLGALNGPWAQRTLGRGIGAGVASFRVMSLGRLAVLSAAGIGIGALLGPEVAWLPVLGIGAAQLGLAAAAVVETARL